MKDTANRASKLRDTGGAAAANKENKNQEKSTAVVERVCGVRLTKRAPSSRKGTTLEPIVAARVARPVT